MNNEEWRMTNVKKDNHYPLFISHSSLNRVVCHINIIGFRTAVAAIKDKSLKGRPFVIAGSTGGRAGTRALALDCSPEAVRQGVTPGTALAVAEKRIKDLIVLPPDMAACELMNTVLDSVASRYAEVWENDRLGNIYFDMTGMASLFGPPSDHASRVLADIYEKADIKPAAAVAINKLVSKVATRAIRPMGLVHVREGTEAEFLEHQDIRLLPGMGQKLLHTAAITGIKEIGEIALLSQSEAVSLFGKHGMLLRNMALGIDTSPVEDRNARRSITQQADFDIETVEDVAIRGAIEALAENGGLEMRNEKLGMRNVRLGVRYSDGVEVQGCEKSKRVLVTDKEIMTAALSVYKKTVNRRIRIRSIFLSLEDFCPLGYQPDLFEPEGEIKGRKLQEAVDKIQNRFGLGKVTKGICLQSASLPIVGIGVSPTAKLQLKPGNSGIHAAFSLNSSKRLITAAINNEE